MDALSELTESVLLKAKELVDRLIGKTDPQLDINKQIHNMVCDAMVDAFKYAAKNGFEEALKVVRPFPW